MGQRDFPARLQELKDQRRDEIKVLNARIQGIHSSGDPDAWAKSLPLIEERLILAEVGWVREGN